MSGEFPEDKTPGSRPEGTEPGVSGLEAGHEARGMVGQRLRQLAEAAGRLLMRAEQWLVPTDTAAIAEHMEQTRRHPEDWTVDLQMPDITPRMPQDGDL